MTQNFKDYRPSIEALKSYGSYKTDGRKAGKNGGTIMKLKDIKLQRFAEDGATGTEGAQGGAGSAGEGENGAGGKTPEDGKKGAESKPGAKYTDDDVNNIIAKKKAEWKKELDKKTSEAEKLAKMNAEQKLEYERDQLQKEIDELKAEKNANEMRTQARNMLKDEGINVSDELVSVLIAQDAESTKQVVESFAKAFNDAVEAAVKEKLKGKTPRGGSGGTSTMTRAEIRKIKDPALRRQAILENPELYR